MRCERCGTELTATRLRILPNTRVCASCSTEERVLTFPTYSSKNTQELCVVLPTAKEAVRQAIRAFKRSR